MRRFILFSAHPTWCNCSPLVNRNGWVEFCGKRGHSILYDDRWGGGVHTPWLTGQMTEEREAGSVIDMEEALLCTAGDRGMLVEMGQMFLAEGPRQLQAIGERIEAQDAPGIRDAAHTLKGSVVIFGARAAADASLAVEHAATDGDLSRVPDAWEALNREMKRLLRDVEQLCRD